MTGLKKLLALIASVEKVPTIGGLPVLIDNARYAFKNGTFDDYTSDDDYFLTGWYDTGSTESKGYVLEKVDTPINLTARWFDDKSGKSIDYWSAKSASQNTFSSKGQYIIASVYKPIAELFYLYDSTNQRYVFKGKNVP